MVAANEKKSSARHATRSKITRNRQATARDDGSSDRQDSPDRYGADTPLSTSASGAEAAQPSRKESDTEMVSSFQVDKKIKPPRLPNWPIGTRVVCYECNTFARVEARISNRIALRWEHNDGGATYTAENLRDMRIVKAAVQNPEEETSPTPAKPQPVLGTRFLRGDRVKIAADDDLRNCSAIVDRSFEADGEVWTAIYCSELPGVCLEYLSKELSFVAGAAPSSLDELERLMEQDKPEPNAHELACTPLATLATAIKVAHGECEQALTVARSAESSALEHAKRAGELLLEAKQANKHGSWEQWRTENTGIPSSTASLYQRVFERWDELQAAKIGTLKGADRYFREAKKLKSAASKPEPKSPTVGDSQSAEKADDRQVVPTSEIESVAPSGWIQTKSGFNLNPQHYKPEQGTASQTSPELIEEIEVVCLELPELDDALIAAHLVVGDARATIEALLWECGFAIEEEGAIPGDPSNPYKGWQIATDSPNGGMLVLCLYTPWGVWWGFPTLEFFGYQDHDRAIDWAQGIVDRMEVAAERAEKPVKKPGYAQAVSNRLDQVFDVRWNKCLKKELKNYDQTALQESLKKSTDAIEFMGVYAAGIYLFQHANAAELEQLLEAIKEAL